MDAEGIGNLIGTLLCTVVPCLALIGIAAGAFFFFRKRKASQPQPAAQPAYPVPVVSPSPAVVSQPAPEQPARVQPAPVEFATPPTQPAPVQPAPAPVVTQFPADPVPAPAASAAFTPGETVLLRGESFSQSAGVLNSYTLLATETKVKGPELAQKVLAAAFLALEQSGSARLEAGKKKVLLASVDTVYVVPTGQPAPFPQGSVEARLLDYAAAYQAKNQNNVNLIVQGFIGEESYAPFQSVLENASTGLAARGLLQVEETRTMKVLKGYKFVMPPETRARVQAADAASTQRLLAGAETSRPDLWKALLKEIKSGIDSRVKSSD